jgi:WKF domain
MSQRLASEMAQGDANPAPKKRSKDESTAAGKAADADADEDKKGPTPEATAAALAYVKLWDTDRSAWKFNKVRQNFLLKWALDPEVVGKGDFPTVVKYFTPLQGGAKALLEQALAKELATPIPDPAADADPKEILRVRILRVRAKRARKLQRLFRGA